MYSDDQNDILKNEAQYQDSKIEKNTRSQMGRYYSDLAHFYVSTYRNQLVGELAGKHILDYGCGTGEMTIKALCEGAIVTAIDISPKSIEYVQKIATEIGKSSQLNALVMDAQNMSFSENTFDVVIGNGILHHLFEMEQALCEIRRVLKPCGYAVFSEPLGMNPLLRAFRKLTPRLRTKDEQPLRMRELELIGSVFPNVQFAFFECFTLLSKPFVALKMTKIANSLQKRLLSLDDRLLHKNHKKFSIFQKWSWIVVFRFYKE